MAITTVSQTGTITENISRPQNPTMRENQAANSTIIDDISGDGDGDGDGEYREFPPAFTPDPQDTTTTTSSTTTTTLSPEESYLKYLGYVPEEVYEEIQETRKDYFITPTGEKERACGGSVNICNIEFALLGDEPSCCTEKTNPECARCLNKCKKICGPQGKGLETCFTDSEKPVCICSDGPPTCYQLLENGEAATTTTLKENDEHEGGASTLLMMVFIFALIVIIHRMVRNMG